MPDVQCQGKFYLDRKEPLVHLRYVQEAYLQFGVDPPNFLQGIMVLLEVLWNQEKVSGFLSSGRFLYLVQQVLPRSTDICGIVDEMEGNDNLRDKVVPCNYPQNLGS